MQTPRLEIYLDKIQHNTQVLTTLCQQYDMALVGITKACAAMPQVARAMLAGGASALGDSHLLNLQRLKQAGIDCPLQLIRTPALSQVQAVVQLADVSLNVDLTVIQHLAVAAQKQGKPHPVVIMVDIGDNREGLQPDDVVDFIDRLQSFEGITVSGLGASTGCRHLVYAQQSQVALFMDVCRRVEQRLGRPLEFISLGGTVALPLLMRGELPAGITQFRVGEALLLGEDAVQELPLEGMYQDAFQLLAEVIEVRRNGEALLAIGSQDVRSSELIPMQAGVTIVADSSDHLIVSMTRKPDIGEVLRFIPNYHGLVHLCTSPYVFHEFVSSANTAANKSAAAI